MAELQRRLLNKEMISDLFMNEWEKETLYEYKIKKIQLRNEIELKIRGVKEKVRVEVFFNEVVPNGLAAVDWQVRWASVKIGEGRLAAIHEELIKTLDQEEYYLPNWIEKNKYVIAEHMALSSSYSSKRGCTTYQLEREVEPELLLEAYSDLARQNDSLERTQLVLHDGKVYSRLMDFDTVLRTEEEIIEYAESNLHRCGDFILDKEGHLYTLYQSVIDDLNNIRVLTKLSHYHNELQPICKYANEHFTFREFAALRGNEVGTLPIAYREEREGERSRYENGEWVCTPYPEVIEIKVFSPRVLGEEIESFKLGDHVFAEGEYGIIIDISEQDKGLYKIQREDPWVYYQGTEAETVTVHCSKMKKVEKPSQDNVGEIIFCRDTRGGRNECKCIGEVVYELHENFIVKAPSFREANFPTGKPRYEYRFSYHSYYVENGDGFIYMTARKDQCVFLKSDYLFWYEQFRQQSEQMEWMKNHEVLGTYLYPLLETFDKTALAATPSDIGYQFAPFLLYVDLQTGEKSPTDIYNRVIDQLQENRYGYLRDITLRGIYNIDVALEKYFTKEPSIKSVDELLELLG